MVLMVSLIPIMKNARKRVPAEVTLVETMNFWNVTGNQGTEIATSRKGQKIGIPRVRRIVRKGLETARSREIAIDGGIWMSKELIEIARPTIAMCVSIPKMPDPEA